MTSTQKPHKIPDQMLRHLEYLRNFHLEGPRIGNTFLQDTALLQYTYHLIGKNQNFTKQLQRLGDRYASIYLQAAKDAEHHQPSLQQFDSYGRRIDKLHLSEGWKKLAKYSAQDGIVAMAYQEDRYKLGQYQRFGQLINLYMYHPSSGLFGCPLAMTDGAAYTLRNLKDNTKTRTTYIDQAFLRLTSRSDAWTSGQWMTQKKGGSDVSNTQTVAVKSNEDKKYRLYGYKWFTSATDSQMTLALGKIIPLGVEPNPQNLKSIQVSLFYIKIRNQKDQLNSMEIIRLKDKLGTKQLPTAQILLKGTQAYLLSQEGKGVKMISKMLTVTRLYNAATAVGLMRRGICLVRDYSSRRVIGKTKLGEIPLHTRVLSQMDVTHRGNLIFYLKIAQLFSKDHAGTINEDQSNILRLMTPILKLFTGKQVLQVLTQCLQSFGGMGFIERSMLPTLLRDAQVLSIWQGTTNVLCADFVRALLKKQNSTQPLQSLNKLFLQIFERIATSQVRTQKFIETNKNIILAYTELIKQLRDCVSKKFTKKMAQLRTLCFGVARLFIGMSLQDYILISMREKDIQVSSRWTKRGIYSPQNFSLQSDRVIGLNLDSSNQLRGTGDVDFRGKQRPRF